MGAAPPSARASPSAARLGQSRSTPTSEPRPHPQPQPPPPSPTPAPPPSAPARSPNLHPLHTPNAQPQPHRRCHPRGPHGHASRRSPSAARARPRRKPFNHIPEIQNLNPTVDAGLKQTLSRYTQIPNLNRTFDAGLPSHPVRYQKNNYVKMHRKRRPFSVADPFQMLLYCNSMVNTHTLSLYLNTKPKPYLYLRRLPHEPDRSARARAQMPVSFPARAAHLVDAACGAGRLFPTGDLTRAAATPPARRGVSDAGLRGLGWSGRVRSGAAREGIRAGRSGNSIGRARRSEREGRRCHSVRGE